MEKITLDFHVFFQDFNYIWCYLKKDNRYLNLTRLDTTALLCDKSIKENLQPFLNFFLSHWTYGSISIFFNDIHGKEPVSWRRASQPQCFRTTLWLQVPPVPEAEWEHQAGLQRGDEPCLHPTSAGHDPGLPTPLGTSPSLTGVENGANSSCPGGEGVRCPTFWVRSLLPNGQHCRGQPEAHLGPLG